MQQQEASKLINFTKDDYYKSATIPPPDDSIFYDGETRATRIVVDSKDRDLGLFPSPNKYTINFDDEVTDIVSAQLLNAYIPTPIYLINSNFNSFMCNNMIIKLTIGDYDPNELAAEITNQLSSQEIICTYTRSLDNYIFVRSVPFTLDFTNPNSITRVLGFKNKQYASQPDGDNSYVINSEFKKDFDSNNYAIMYIEQFDINKSSSSILNKSFAIIPNKNDKVNFSDEKIITKFFAPPLGKLDKLRIKFFDRFGNPYDFQNMDHRFEILLKSHKQRRKYGPIMKNHY